MPVPTSPASWVGSLLWLIGLTGVAFLVTWICADKLNIRRAPYIGVLTVVTAGLAVGYVAWLGVGVGDLLTARWGWGLLAAPFVGAFLSYGITKLPATRRLTGRQLGVAALWEGVVYGVTEGVLLSMLPVLMTWQMIHSLGWSGAPGAVGRWTLPIVASVVVIVAHHLGYWEYRNRLLVPISVGCGLMSLGYLVTASPIAPVVAHIISHLSSLRHGSDLPPHAHDDPDALAELNVDLRSQLKPARHGR